MTTITVEGSKNNFNFGPDRLEIPDRLTKADEAAAVIDALTRSDYPDGISSTPAPDLQQPQAGTARERAIQHGFTAVRYRRGEGGGSIRIL